MTCMKAPSSACGGRCSSRHAMLPRNPGREVQGPGTEPRGLGLIPNLHSGVQPNLSTRTEARGSSGSKRGVEGLVSSLRVGAVRSGSATLRFRRESSVSQPRGEKRTEHGVRALFLSSRSRRTSRRPELPTFSPCPAERKSTRRSNYKINYTDTLRPTLKQHRKPGGEVGQHYRVPSDRSVCSIVCVCFCLSGCVFSAYLRILGTRCSNSEYTCFTFLLLSE